jgi:hypothetical protein
VNPDKISETGLTGFFLRIIKGKSRKLRNLENPDTDKISEAGFGGLWDGHDFFLESLKMSEAGFIGLGDLQDSFLESPKISKAKLRG